MMWLMASPWRWAAASLIFGALAYLVPALLIGDPLDVAWLVAIALVGAVCGWFGWHDAYGSKRGGRP